MSNRNRLYRSPNIQNNGEKNLKGRARLVVFLALFAVAFVVAVEVQRVHAAVQEFHLYGSYVSGWGFSSGSLTSPGPTITVTEGDVVNLTLTNMDTGYYAPSHQFLLSYHNSSTPQSDDVVSSFFASGNTIVLSFTANVSGTFTYYCTVHPSPMYGTFVVNSAVPEFPSLIALSCFMTIVVAAALLYKTRSQRAREQKLPR